MPLLKPFRDYNEKDVINLYTFSGQTSTTQIINRGTLVAIVGDGWRNDTDPTELIGNYGDFSVNNVQAPRYGTPAKVSYAGTGSYPLGITLFDIRELDENLIPLKYNPRKAAELEACISGQTVPIVTRGIFLYSGLAGTLTPGQPLYAGAAGAITQTPVTGVSGTVLNSFAIVGLVLGVTGVDGSALIKLTL
jgi:hypothetical protein